MVRWSLRVCETRIGGTHGLARPDPEKVSESSETLGWDEKPSKVHLLSTSWHRRLSWGSVFYLVQHLEGGTAFLNVLAPSGQRGSTCMRAQPGDSVGLHSILSWIQKGLSHLLLRMGGSSRLPLVSIHTADISLVRNRTWFLLQCVTPHGGFVLSGFGGLLWGQL